MIAANLPIFKQRLSGLCTAWGPFCNPRSNTHFGNGVAWLVGQVWVPGGRVAIGGVTKRSVRWQPSSSSIQKV